MDRNLVFAGDLPRQTISSRAAAGQLRRITTGIYTTDLTTPLERVVAEQWPDIAGRLIAGAVITDRSGRTGGPVGHILYLAHDGRPRVTELPGLTISTRTGTGPLDSDIPLPGGLYQASKARALAENSMPSRARAGRPARTLDEIEMCDWIDDIGRLDGPERLNEYRRQANELAPQLGVRSEALDQTNALIGAVLGTRTIATKSTVISARQQGNPYDRSRTARFDLLVSDLHNTTLQSNPVRGPGRYRTLPFFEAYFSNFIEGTEFSIDEARDIIYGDNFPYQRAADGHDLLGTFQLLTDRGKMLRIADTGQEFIDLLKERNAEILEGRPDKRPGQLKEAANQAGQTLFVAPELVKGTLLEGFKRIADLDTAWEKAVYAAFVASEVHPFDDGNGRTARATMSSYLDAGQEVRIIVPTAFRNDYLDGLRKLSRQDQSDVFIKGMRFLHRYTDAIDFGDFDRALDTLRETNAFDDPVRGAPIVIPPRHDLWLEPDSPRGTRHVPRDDGTPVGGEPAGHQHDVRLESCPENENVSETC